MLVLTRKTEQKIQIGPDITITILRVKGQSVRIGIDAPQNVRVLRAELPPRDEFGPETLVEEPVDSTFESNFTAAPANAAPLSNRQRDRSVAGSMPRLHPDSADRSEGPTSRSSAAHRLSPHMPRLSSSLADRVAARRSSDKGTKV